MVQRPIRPHLCLTSGPLMDRPCCISARVRSVSHAAHILWEGGVGEIRTLPLPLFIYISVWYCKKKKEIHSRSGWASGLCIWTFQVLMDPQLSTKLWNFHSARHFGWEFTSTISFPAHSWGIPPSRSSWPPYPSTRNCTYASTKVLFKQEARHFQSGTQLNSKDKMGIWEEMAGGLMKKQ